MADAREFLAPPPALKSFWRRRGRPRALSCVRNIPPWGICRRKEATPVPAAVKNSENMTKHLTKAELDARLRAEEEVLPQRQRVKLK